MNNKSVYPFFFGGNLFPFLGYTLKFNYDVFLSTYLFSCYLIVIHVSLSDMNNNYLFVINVRLLYCYGFAK